MKSIYRILTVIFSVTLFIPVSAQAAAKGSYTTQRFRAPELLFKPSKPQHQPKTVELPNNINICLLEDGTWHSANNSLQGGWTMVGNQISLSGNSDADGVSAVINTLQPDVSFAGNWDSWSITNPTAEQTLDTVLLTKTSDTCQ